MPDECLPKKILYGELQVGKCSHGSQKKQYKDTLKASLKDFNIPTVMGTDCTGSSQVAGVIRRGAGEYMYKAKRIWKAKQKHAQREAT